LHDDTAGDEAGGVRAVDLVEGVDDGFRAGHRVVADPPIAPSTAR
jgi:hypothetical protein